MASVQAALGDPFVIERPPHFGIIIRDLDIDAIDRPEVRERLNDLWTEEGLIIFKGLFGRDTLVRLSAIFGSVQDTFLPEYHTENKEVHEVRFSPDTGWLMELDGRLLGGWQPWHTDSIFLLHPQRGGLITAIKSPREDGRTGFIDKIAVYDSLPDDIKQRIDGLSAIYNANAIEGFERPRFGQKAIKTIRYSEVVTKVHDRMDDFPEVVHPMVMRQPGTGRKLLNICPLFVQRIEGMDKAESDALLRVLIEHATDEKRAYFHSYEPGDMVLWDNWRAFHCATGGPPDEERIMEKTFIGGDYNLGHAL
jgi:taurine dioxygenase